MGHFNQWWRDGEVRGHNCPRPLAEGAPRQEMEQIFCDFVAMLCDVAEIYCGSVVEINENFMLYAIHTNEYE